MADLDTKEHIQNIYDVLEERARILESNQRNIEMLFLTLKGSDEFGNLGYKDRIRGNEEDIETIKNDVDRQEERFNNIYSKVVGICIGVSIAASSIGFLIKNSIVKGKATTIHRVERVDDYPINNPTYPDLTKDLGKAVIREKDSLTTKR